MSASRAFERPSKLRGSRLAFVRLNKKSQLCQRYVRSRSSSSSTTLSSSTIDDVVVLLRKMRSLEKVVRNFLKFTYCISHIQPRQTHWIQPSSVTDPTQLQYLVLRSR